MAQTPDTTDPKLKNHHNRKRWLITLACIFIVLGILYLIYWLAIGQFYQTTDDAYVSGNQVKVMPKISGQVTKILADETNLVIKGKPIVYLDSADAVIALGNAEANLALTVRQVSELYTQVKQLQANVNEQQANYKKALEDYQRRQGLTINKTITAEDLRHAKIAVDSAAASLASAQQQLTSAIAVVANSNLYHHPQVEQAEVIFRQAYLTWKRTTIYTPETGYVAKRYVQVGQQVTPDTVLMIIVPLSQVWIDANFKESQLKNMRIDQPATVIADAYGSDVVYQGKVMGLNPGSGNAFDLLPPQNATGNWIKIVQRLPVRILLDAKQLVKYPLRIGLSVTVTIDTTHHDGKALATIPNNKIIYQTLDYSADLTEANQMIEKILAANAKNISYP